MPDETPRELFLIDGNSLVYRAFFALPESIATSRGFPTNAIFGFASMLVKLLTEYGPKPTLVVWDAGMSGRLETYEEYKAGRRERPDLLKEQWPHLHPLVDAFGYTNVRVEGYEADDVIATLSREAHEQGIDVMIVTGDRDLFQLVEDGVRVMATGRGITDTKIYDREAVVDRYGIPPELVPDFVGLKGDTSDNIPGVPGIGEKTATQLLQEYGDLEGVLANIDSISGAKRKENLREHAEDARISKQLATAQREIEVGVDLDECIAREPDRSRLREVFREFELRAPLERLEEALGDGRGGARGAARGGGRGQARAGGGGRARARWTASSWPWRRMRPGRGRWTSRRRRRPTPRRSSSSGRRSMRRRPSAAREEEPVRRDRAAPGRPRARSTSTARSAGR